ncbi:MULTISPECIES: nucleoside hydrolase [Microbacterium]|uniref:nucleoside hydrolase n=1 Tax=Microbacterium TaxID=33882 RepID=UPI00146A02BE|nr:MULTISPECIES: nucleoside hydrolase [Microbacterium]
MNRNPVILDTDPGLGEPGSDIDDGLAIALAVLSPEIDLLGLTIVNGNVDTRIGVDVARRLADRLKVPELPVLAGATQPLRRDMEPVKELFRLAVPNHGEATSRELLGPTSAQHAADWMIDRVLERPGEITIVAIGPMTNLARAIQREPRFAESARELVLMAGAATGYAQNITVVGDFNTYVDPEALQIVLDSGARIRMVGLDQTARVLLTRDDAQVLARASDGFSSWAGECANAWIDFLSRAFPNRPEHQHACFLHDPLVVAAVLDSSLLTWADAHVEAELTSELARGLVVADRGLALARPRPANASVAIDTDVEGFRDLFLSRLSQPERVESVPLPAGPTHI